MSFSWSAVTCGPLVPSGMPFPEYTCFHHAWAGVGAFASSSAMPSTAPTASSSALTPTCAPVVFGSNYQGTPATQNAAATLTTAKVMSGLITCTQATGATIAVLLPNGADMELAAQFDVGDYFDWVFVNNSVAAAASGA